MRVFELQGWRWGRWHLQVVAPHELIVFGFYH